MRSSVVFAVGAVVVAALFVFAARDAGKLSLPALAGRTELEQLLLGTWKGQTGCAGDFRFHEDGTYELLAHSPACIDSAGTWEVQWDALPPTIDLTCRTSSWPEEVGQITKVKLLRLDGESLHIDHSGTELASGGVARYGRPKPE